MEYVFWIIGYVLIIIVGWLLKKGIEKSIDGSIEMAFSKSIAKYQDSLTRASAARRFIFDREMTFFELADDRVADLIPIIQDMRDSVEKRTFSEYDKMCYLKYFESMFDLKKLVLKYEAYISKPIYLAYYNLVIEMQEKSEMWHDFSAMLSSGKKPVLENRENAKLSCESLLRSIASVRLNQIKYLEEVSYRQSE